MCSLFGPEILPAEAVKGLRCAWSLIVQTNKKLTAKHMLQCTHLKRGQIASFFSSGCTKSYMVSNRACSFFIPVS